MITRFYNEDIVFTYIVRLRLICKTQETMTQKRKRKQKRKQIIILKTNMYYDVMTWKHFPCYWSFCAGNSPVTCEFPSQRPVTWSFEVVFLMLNGWLNNRDAGDWRQHLAHYDGIVMWLAYVMIVMMEPHQCPIGKHSHYSLAVEYTKVCSWTKYFSKHDFIFFGNKGQSSISPL